MRSKLFCLFVMFVVFVHRCVCVHCIYTRSHPVRLRDERTARYSLAIMSAIKTQSNKKMNKKKTNKDKGNCLNMSEENRII